MNAWTKVLLMAAVVLFSNVSAFAMPEFLQLYLNDPFRNPNFSGCDTCHMSPAGGDDRNDFGQAFERGGMMITTMLRAQFPDRFVYPVSRVNNNLTIYFADPANKQTVVEVGGMRTLVDVEMKTAGGQPAAAQAAAARPATAQGGALVRPVSDVRTDPFAREGAFFGANVVNLPNGKPLRRGEWDFFIGHRFSEDIDRAGLGGLFGFDSSATVAYGVKAGLTDRINVGLMRSNFDKTISLTAALQISRQSAEVPLTLQLRAGVDGVQNFGLCDDDENFSCRKQYSPFLQATLVRTFGDRVSFLLSPIFAFRTKNEDTFFPPEFVFGSDHRDTISLGVGTGIRLLPSVSLVGEFIPRLYGFRGERKDYPGVSIGLQKSTFRHTFELVVSRQQVITPVQVGFQGNDTFNIGFNIYRRLR
jgi:uncharacterized beta barrel domain-containing protein DUF5777